MFETRSRCGRCNDNSREAGIHSQCTYAHTHTHTHTHTHLPLLLEVVVVEEVVVVVVVLEVEHTLEQTHHVVL
jgi:hypothetical protein